MGNYFPREELACRCGCDIYNISPVLLEILNAVREEYGKPIKVISGCRCPEHNRSVSRTPDSEHVTTKDFPCEGVDIAVSDSGERWELVDLFKKNGIRRIGVYPRHVIHIGVDPFKPQDVMWVR